MRVEVRDGEILKTDPQDMVAFVAIPFSKWFENVPYA
jgi:hypothetical protein